MIFATDLDRTLIYSNKFINQAISVQVVEKRDGKNISYITPKALGLLKKLYEKMIVIPVTTRNRRQFASIDLFQSKSTYGMRPHIHIVNNGGTIYIEGQEDKKWTQMIEAGIKTLVVQPKVMIEVFLQYYTGTILSYTMSDDLLWCILIKEDVKKDELEVFKYYANILGWDIMNQGRKTYLCPSFINKWEALSYIKKLYPKEYIVCAGDSEFDFEMIHQADYGITPKNSFIEERCQAKIFRTKETGLKSGEEILEQVLMCYMAVEGKVKEK